jgi:hypothetical protein
MGERVSSVARRKRHQAPNRPTHRLQPLLKWAGGKRQLLAHLRRFYPRDFGRYIEPFFGSGAVFFDLHASGRLSDHDVVLIDSNADLIVGCDEMVRQKPEAGARPRGPIGGGSCRRWIGARLLRA